ncbi:heterokaryon incompatibility protein-domain-containing protein [Apiospora phragmitis]|uniref:Heterokaryon incompatibility protein-domain-containing protein n=1 Tax=Apiospora phragmitis TaxID=2905665 RepID=A0ABR1UH34_9PEZI
MRLINTLTLELEHFIEPPPYAILSHRWTEEEVLFEDVGKPLSEWQGKAGASKVLQGSVTALALGHRYIWIDSCCIDKKSSAELTEAINSLYAWYRNAEVCLAFLSDVQSADTLLGSLWFTRGWTLQELVAPCSLRFYSAGWDDLGSRETWAKQISQTTGIGLELLQQQRQLRGTPDSARQLLSSYSTHKKMSWAAKSVTTRAEDLAYSMIGIFGVSMPLIYGEGRAKAFRRLQEEILKSTYDQSILAHISTTPSPSLTMGPEAFSFGLEILKRSHSATHRQHKFTHGRRETIRLYDGDQPYMKVGAIDRPEIRPWQDRAILLGTITQSAGSRYSFGCTTPDEHEGLVSLAHVLRYVPGMEIRSIIWLSVTEGEICQYRCAILVGHGPSSDTVRCWPVTAETIFPYAWLRGRSLDSSNPDLMDLLSRQSVVKMLGKITGPPLGAGGFIPRGMSDLKMGLDNIKTELKESTFLETSYLTLNVEVNSQWLWSQLEIEPNNKEREQRLRQDLSNLNF